MGFYSTFVCHGIVKHVVSSKLGSRSDSAGKHDIVRDIGDNSHTSPPFKKEIKLSSVGSVPWALWNISAIFKIDCLGKAFLHRNRMYLG